MATGLGIKPDRQFVDVKTVGFVKEDVRLVAESIHRIINTTPGERPQNPNFGCRIKTVLFEPNDFSSGTLGAYLIYEALTKFEPRAIIENITVRLDPTINKMVAEIFFKMRNSPEQLFRTVTTI